MTAYIIHRGHLFCMYAEELTQMRAHRNHEHGFKPLSIIGFVHTNPVTAIRQVTSSAGRSGKGIACMAETKIVDSLIKHVNIINP